MSLVKSGANWLSQTFGWSNSRASWRERLTLALFLALAGGLGCLSIWIPLWQSALLWAAYVVAVAVGTRQGWLQLIGPVLFYDMIRTARQSRFVFMRMIYAALLLFILCFTYLNVAAHRRVNIDMFTWSVIGFVVFLLMQVGWITWLRLITSLRGRLIIASIITVKMLLFLGGVILLALWDDREMTPRETAVLAETYFAVFMSLQLFLVALLTPAYVGGAIADEKERKTLEFMLATDLNNHEIVLSKLLSRLANIALFLLTGLPILSILQFLGGVDVELMLMGFAATGLTMLGIASLSILFSTLFKRPRDAIGLAYLAIITYSGLGLVGKVSTLKGALFMAGGIFPGGSGPTLSEIADWYNTGNPLVAMIDVGQAIRRATLAADLPPLLTAYAYFHGVLSLVCIVWSIARLRAIALKQTVGGKTQKLPWWDRYRPAIGDLPMLWKELHIENRIKLNWVAWGIIIVLVLLTLGSGVMVLANYFMEGWQAQNRFWTLSREMNMWFRFAGTGVALLLTLMLAVRASTCITSERERDTFDALLTTPMGAEAMLGAKLLGCLTSLRLALLWFGAMVAIALFTGGIHLFAVPIVLAAWVIYAVFFTMVGMWFSMACQSSMRATVLTVLTVLFLGGGHWLLLGLCLYFPAAMLMPGGPGEFLEYFLKFHAGMTPPAVLVICSYSWENLAHDFRHDHEYRQLVVFSLIGLFLWAVGCVILWYGMLLPKFRDLTRREELIYQ